MNNIKSTIKYFAVRFCVTVALFFTANISVTHTVLAQPTANWSSPPVSVSLLGQTTSTLQIRLSADGTKAIAIWSAFDGMALKIQTRVATITGNSATWGVTVNAIGTGGNPQIAISEDGTKATAIWTDGPTPVIKSASATISGDVATWGTESDVYTGNSIINYLEHPMIDLSADGTMATALWADTPPMSNKIVKSANATVSGNVATWGGVTDLNTSGQEPKGVDLDLSANGTTAVVTWARYNGMDSAAQSLIASISGNSAMWGTAEDISTVGQNTYATQVAISDDGGTVSAIWPISTISEPQVKNRTATISSGLATWGAVIDVSTAVLLSITNNVQISLSDDGAVASSIWYGNNGSNDVVQSSTATITDNTATWGSVQDLSDVGTNNYEAAIVISGDGNITTALWSRIGTGEEIIQSRSATILGNIATWGSSVDVSNSGQTSYSGALSTSNDGLMGTALWSANGSGFHEVHSSSFAIELSTPTPTATVTSTATATQTATATSTSTTTPTNTATSTATMTPTATNTQAATITPTLGNTPEITVINSGSKENALGIPQVESSSSSPDGSTSIRTCINFKKVKGTANIYGVVKRVGNPKNLIFKRVKRGNPCFTFNTTNSGLYDIFFRQNRYLQPPLFSKRLRVKT